MQEEVKAPKSLLMSHQAELQLQFVQSVLPGMILFWGGKSMGRKELYENDSPLVLCLDVCSNSPHTTLKTIAQCPKNSLASGLRLFVSEQSY